jgi:hypothetical protein
MCRATNANHSSNCENRRQRATHDCVTKLVDVLDDWRREVKRISNVLPIDLDAGDGVAVEEFLEPNLRRQRERGRVTEPFGTDWLSVAYEDLSTAARDDPWDQSELDRILTQYEMSERGFRMMHDDFHHAFNNLAFGSLASS